MGRPKGLKHTKEEKEKIGKGVRKYISENPSYLNRLSALMKKRYSRASERKRVSEWMKKFYSSSTGRLKTSIAMKKYFNEHPKSKNLDYIRNVDRAMTKWWKEHPNIRKERSLEIKKLFIEHPDKFRKFMKFGGNSAALHYKTKKGYHVRSRGEQKIADFLFENKIKALYEAKTLTFPEEGQICVPDFYLEDYGIFIEFYGGHPKAWKKKVMKNKLYKKYNIPCIFITPAELRDLSRYIIWEIVN